MNRALAGVGVGWSLVLVLGCSSSKPSTAATAGAANASGGAANAGTAGQTSTPGGSGGGTTHVTGPAITSAPPAWIRPADCGGVGDLCPNLFGCVAQQSTCQLEGNVCIPAFPPGATSLPGRTAETPYCAAYTCMNFAQASCFCTGEAGKTVPACESPSALALLCVSKGASCATTACCAGSSCVSIGNGQKQCQVTCQTNADCADTGCCADPHEVGVSVCSPKAACDNPCKKGGDTSCDPGSTTTPTDCCNGTCVQSTVPSFAGCRPYCSTNADCKSGCCQPFDNSTSGFCADAAYCVCAELGGECGPNAPNCCDGATCASNDAQNGYQCYPSCKTDADCSSKCCSVFDGEDHGVCVAASACEI